mgnify:CR=1 FL=1
MELRNLDDVIGDYTGLSRKILDYSALMKRMVARRIFTWLALR